MNLPGQLQAFRFLVAKNNNNNINNKTRKSHRTRLRECPSGSSTGNSGHHTRPLQHRSLANVLHPNNSTLNPHRYGRHVDVNRPAAALDWSRLARYKERNGRRLRRADGQMQRVRVQ